MIKLKVSYENKDELIDFITHIRDDISKFKVKEQQKGKYKIAYVELKNNDTK